MEVSFNLAVGASVLHFAALAGVVAAALVWELFRD
jgi:hypothetical protein